MSDTKLRKKIIKARVTWGWEWVALRAGHRAKRRAVAWQWARLQQLGLVL